MKKYLFALCLVFAVGGARAACVAEGTTYSCETGYYLSGTSCLRCPSSGGVYGTTSNYNRSGITSCYIPANTSVTDDSGTYVFTSSCYYTQ